MPRLFDFQGSDSDYIKFLELKVLEAEGASLSANLSTNTWPSALSSAQQPYEFQFVIVKPKQLNDFIASVPSEENWVAAKHDAGIYTAQRNARAIKLMLGETTEAISPSQQGYIHPETPSIPLSDNGDSILRAHKYGAFIFTCADEGKFASRVTEYQKLIFISYCTVLIYTKNSKETVYSMMRKYINKDSDDKTLDYYRYGALWANRCIASLLYNGLGHRSWEIFLLQARSPAQFGRSAIYDCNSFQEVATRLGCRRSASVLATTWT
ncbi:hypothetical protein BDV25DRAFT_143843 [Aspergillus avenaceus]|uniref:Uncharacterized protein n=1 Tax=Aspergillus avenaceus TaxID=36643 RepID=A0A5N6TIT4_ASPAV|nr:hypothetical protein BDV25DRAFT_143843 [Aspergillus avenaceus]